MHVVYSCVRFPPARGGVESYVELMADVMAENDHQVGVVTSRFSQHLPGSRRELAPDEMSADARKPYPVIRLEHHALRTLDAYPFSLRAPSVIASLQPSLIHAHCFYYASVDAAALASLVTKVPLVLSPSLPIRVAPRWAWYRRGMGWLFRYASVTTVLSQFERNLLHRSGLHPGRTVMVPPAIRRHKQSAGDVVLPWDERNARILLFVGRVSNSKGVDTLIDALPMIVRHDPAVRLVLAGPLVRADVDRYQTALCQSGLTQHVWIAGEVASDVLDGLYRASELFVFPSRYEAFGIVALEAMSYGLPVVVSDAAALPEVIGWGERGLLHATGNCESLARAVARLLDDPDLRDRVREAALKHVAAEHSERAHYERLSEVYELAHKRMRRSVRRASDH
ncbi:MAG: glycosyltransferase family 4 protein [Solirubrobacteraceae bacterium]